MINEANQVAVALRGADITAAAWDRRYGPIANIKKNAPCIQIVLDGEKVASLESVPTEKGATSEGLETIRVLFLQ